MSVLATFHTVCGCTRRQIIPEPPPWQQKVAYLLHPRTWPSANAEVDPARVAFSYRVFERSGRWQRSSEHQQGWVDYYEVVS